MGRTKANGDETADDADTNAGAPVRSKPRGSSDDTPFSVRLTQEDRDRLNAVAELYSRQTGGRQSAHSMAQTFIRLGLSNFEQAGGLVVVQ